MAGSVYLEHISAYVPAGRIDNAAFSALTDKEPDWFVARTGIHSRSRAAADESTTSMGISAVRQLVAEQGESALAGVDLVIASSYTPDDTLSTMASYIQQAFAIADARVYFLATACSSFISALELARVMIRAGEAKRALVVMSEHNSFYSDDADRFSGHLWGDGAAAVIVSADASAAEYRLDYARSRGAACAGKGPQAIALRPAEGARGLVMYEGRDVFARACEYMVNEVREAVATVGLQTDDLDWLVPHQANLRILSNVAKTLGLPMEKCVVTVDTLGNTGCASIPISLVSAAQKIRPGDRIAAVAFGGGYSSGAALLTRL